MDSVSINSSGSNPVNPLVNTGSTTPLSGQNTSADSSGTTGTTSSSSTSSTSFRRSSRLLAALTTPSVQQASVSSTVSFQSAFDTAVSASQTAYNLDTTGATNFVNTELQKPLSTLIVEEKAAAQDSRHAQMANNRNQLNLTKGNTILPKVSQQVTTTSAALVQQQGADGINFLGATDALGSTVNSIVNASKALIGSAGDTNEELVQQLATTINKYAEEAALILQVQNQLLQGNSPYYAGNPSLLKSQVVDPALAQLTAYYASAQDFISQQNALFYPLNDNRNNLLNAYFAAESNLANKADTFSAAKDDYITALNNVSLADNENDLARALNVVQEKRAALAPAKSDLDQAVTDTSKARDNWIAGEDAFGVFAGTSVWTDAVNEFLPGLMSSLQTLSDSLQNNGAFDLSSFQAAAGNALSTLQFAINKESGDLNVYNQIRDYSNNLWNQNVAAATSQNTELQTNQSTVDNKLSQILPYIRTRNDALKSLDFYDTLVATSTAKASQLQANVVSTNNIYVARRSIRLVKQLQ